VRTFSEQPWGISTSGITATHSVTSRGEPQRKLIRKDHDVQIPAVNLPDLDRLALLVVDVQRGFDDTGY
jgi:hypothetical protein